MAPLRNIPIELIRTFVALADIRSFSRAAEALGLSQPSVSQHLPRLEQLLEAVLVQGPGVNLTDEAYEILPLARQILALNDEILQLTWAGPRPWVRIGVVTGYVDVLLTHHRKLTVLLDRDVQIVQDDMGRLLDQLAQSQYDAVVGLTDRSSGAAASWNETLTWVAAPDLELPAGLPVPLVELRSPLLRQLTRGALRASERLSDTVLLVPDIGTQLRAVAAGIGIAVVPERASPAELTTRAAELPPLPSIKGAVWVSRRLPETVSTQLVDAIREYMTARSSGAT